MDLNNKRDTVGENLQKTFFQIFQQCKKNKIKSVIEKQVKAEVGSERGADQQPEASASQTNNL